MASRRILYYKLRALTWISVIWVVFAFLFLYNVILIEKKMVTGRSLLLFSLAFAIIGFVISAALVFYLKNALRNYPVWLSVIIKLGLTFVLFMIVGFVMLFFYYIFGDHKKPDEYINEFPCLSHLHD